MDTILQSLKNGFGEKGLKIERDYTRPENNLLDKIEYELRTSQITNEAGKVIHLQEDVEVPVSWSQVATDVLSQKYFRKRGVPKFLKDEKEIDYSFKTFQEKYNKTFDDFSEDELTGENSIKQVAHRLAGTWTYWGKKYNYFESDEDACAFYDELKYCLIMQICSPNSPQWFNTGLAFAYGIIGKSQGHYYVEELNSFNKHLPSSLRLKRSEDSYTHPQPHACFIQGVNDDLVNPGGIFDLLTREARVFKYGSGTGSNFSYLRGKHEKLAGGGTSSGLMSFLSIFDKAAGSIKSGGTTRRAAKMVCLDIDHPEIETFINWKAKEERKVASLVTGSHIVSKVLKNIVKFAVDKNDNGLKSEIQKANSLDIPLNYVKRILMLVDQGELSVDDFEYETYETDFRSESYSTVDGQNSNNSIRITDDFMRKIENDEEWNLTNRTDGNVYKTLKARDLWHKISFAAWQCADPGIQFDTTINDWHTCAADGPIRASNPCSEYMFLDETACNLASINLDKFLNASNLFEVKDFSHVVRLWTIVLEVSVLMAQLISDTMALRTYQYRTLGLGYANLGTVLMKSALPYDSKESNAYAACITAILTGEAYTTSAEMAKVKGPFERYNVNADCMLKVIRNHRRAAYNVKHIDPNPSQTSLNLNDELGGYEHLSILPVGIDPQNVPYYLVDAARYSWDKALALGKEFGFRNAQVTVIAPTGTIGLQMDCQTTGIEPDFALIKFKKLVGGGYFKLVNQAVPMALKNLGYSASECEEIVKFIDNTSSFEGAPHLKIEHYPIFDCANKCGENGKRFIGAVGHVNILAATQPFISGSISKTINLPEEATVQDIKDLYTLSWKLGLKCNAIYRDSSKLSQPLSVGSADESDKYAKFFNFTQEQTEESNNIAPAVIDNNSKRKKLSNERASITHKFEIGNHEGYLTVGLYDDGTPGEVFIQMSKEGSTLSGIVNAWAITTSLALQYGVPLETLVRKYTFTKFEPAGFTSNKNIPIAQSIVDYIGKWMALKFLPKEVALKYHNQEIVERVFADIEKKTENLNSQAVVKSTLETEIVKPQENNSEIVTIRNTLNTHEVSQSYDSKDVNDFLKLNNEDAPACTECGSVMVRNGSCYKCLSCGSTSGCS